MSAPLFLINMQVTISNNVVDYQEALKHMEQRVEDIINNKNSEEIWLLEHKPVYTAGTSAKSEDLIDDNGFPIFNVGRGGKYTYHGPGQRICYLMLNLKKHYKTPDLRQFVKDIENSTIDSLAEIGVKGFIREGRVGIWCYDKKGLEKKIGAIGIRVRKWVSFHGLSININPNLKHFEGIIPCGISEFGVTSLKELGINISTTEFDEIFLRNLKIGNLVL